MSSAPPAFDDDAPGDDALPRDDDGPRGVDGVPRDVDDGPRDVDGVSRDVDDGPQEVDGAPWDVDVLPALDDDPLPLKDGVPREVDGNAFSLMSLDFCPTNAFDAGVSFFGRPPTGTPAKFGTTLVVLMVNCLRFLSGANNSSSEALIGTLSHFLLLDVSAVGLSICSNIITITTCCIVSLGGVMCDVIKVHRPFMQHKFF